MPSSIQVIGGAVLVGGILWLWHSNRKAVPSIPALPPKNSVYPIPAETNKYPEPPASQTASLPPIALAGSCSVDTPDEYNALAKVMGLPLFEGILPTNAPDDPATQTFNTLVTGLKTMGGCYAPMDQDDTGTAMPSNWAEQSASYK
jgi:hypothetical protein